MCLNYLINDTNWDGIHVNHYVNVYWETLSELSHPINFLFLRRHKSVYSNTFFMFRQTTSKCPSSLIKDQSSLIGNKVHDKSCKHYRATNLVAILLKICFPIHHSFKELCIRAILRMY